MAKSTKKKISREEKMRREKIQRTIVMIVGIVVGLAVAGCIGWVVVYSLSFRIEETTDYSIGLTDDGLIESVSAKDYVTLCDYKNMTFNYEDLAVSDEDLETYINGLLDDYKGYTMDEDRTVAMGDEINIDYVGSIDGVEFEGGSTQGAGTDITVGSAGYIDDFEEQLVGHKAGESFDINVTFPEDYANADVAGKDAVFAITVNGIYEKPEFNDDFVQTYLSEEARTADAFIQNYKDEQYNEKLEQQIEDYILKNSTVNSYPNKYVKKLMQLVKGSAIEQYKSYNEYYQSSYGQTMYSSFDDYTGMDRKEYYASARTDAEEIADRNLIYQAIYEDAGLNITDESKKEVLAGYGIGEDYYTEIEETYGKGYLSQSAIVYTVLDYLKGIVTVEGQP